MAKRSGCLINLSHIPYQDAWDFQRFLVQERGKSHCDDTLMIVEHDPVFTMGRSTKAEHWKSKKRDTKSSEFEIYKIERGGSVTYHGPGQIVGYPILRLREFCPGPKVYVGMLQEVIIRVLAEWKIPGHLKAKFPGVWVEKIGTPFQKIAAVGVRITRGVTMHGLALNVNVDLKPFDLITPCGIEGCQVTSMEKFLGQQVDVLKVRERFSFHFAKVFGLEWTKTHDRLPRMKSASSLSVL